MSAVAHRPQPGGLRAAWQDRLAHRRRRLLAQGLEAVLHDVHQPSGRWMSARVPVRANQVLAAERDIERLIGRLRGGRPVPEEGLALARALLLDRGSPLFASSEPQTLRQRVRAILAAMG